MDVAANCYWCVHGLYVAFFHKKLFYYFTESFQISFWQVLTLSDDLYPLIWTPWHVESVRGREKENGDVEKEIKRGTRRGKEEGIGDLVIKVMMMMVLMMV